MEILTFNHEFGSNHFGNHLHDGHYENIDINQSVMVETLAHRLHEELRHAKNTHLDCGDVQLPTTLLRSASQRILDAADAEPYGLRGCTLYINYDGGDESGLHTPIAIVDCDPTTPSTFQIALTLRRASNAWNDLLPRFIKKMTKGGNSIVISPIFDLEKKKLYRSYDC